MNIWPWLKRILTAISTAAAISLGVLIQLVLVVLVCLALPDKIVGPILLTAPVGIGIGSYFIFQRFIGNRTIRLEAERWLARRSRRSPQQRARLHRGKQIGVWIPTLVVAIAFLFLPELFGVATHVLPAKPAVLNGYLIHRPITWMVFDAVIPSNKELQNAAAFEFKGPLRSGFSGFLGLYPQASAMSFSFPRDSEGPFREGGEALAIRTFQIGNESVICREYVRVSSHITEDPNNQAVDCRSATGRFFASFYGNRSSVSEFYETLRNIRQQ